MKKNYTNQSWNSKLLIVIFVAISLLPFTKIAGQTTVFADDFNRGTTTYTTAQAFGIPAATYNTGNASNGALTYRLWAGTDYCLQISGTGTAGNTFTYFDNSVFSFPYNASAGLSASSGLITWYYSFRNYGNSANYKSAVVLGASNTDFNLGNGYAVYYNKNAVLKFSLAKFTGGVSGTTTDIIPELTTTDLASATNQDFCSIMVTYDPSTNNWSLFVRDDAGATAPAVPWITTANTYNQHGSTVSDATYTTATDNLRYSGFFYKHSTTGSATYKGSFDNFKVTQIATTAPTVQSGNLVFTPIAINTLTANWTNGNGGKRIVIMNTTNSFTAPINGVEPTANALYNGTGEQVVYNGTGSSVNISGLTASTQYWFKVYDYSYGAALYPIYQVTSSTNNPNSVTTLGAVVAPTVTTPTVSSILNNSALLGGTITSDGGASITDRGTVWKTTSRVTTSDNLLSEGGTATGSFTSNRTSLPSKTLIYYAAYATNSAGTSLSAESSFYTKADLPTTAVGSFATNTISDNTQLQLTWIPATNADGYLITQKVGGSPAGTAPANGIAYSAGDVLGTGIVCAIIKSGSAATVNITGLLAGSQYTFRIYPFGYDGLNAQTFNYASSLSADASGSTLLGTGLDNPHSNLIAYVSNNKLMVFEGDVYNTMGVKIASINNVNRATELSLRSGIYIVKSATGTQKVVIP